MSTSSDFVERMQDAFKSEALDLLAELDTALLEMESKPEEAALVHRVFRAIHTIKGSAGMTGYAHLARFAHTVEEAFEQARAGRLAVTAELVDCGLRACDVIRLILERPAEADILGELEVTAALERLVKTTPSRQSEEADKPEPLRSARAAYEIVFKPKREMFYSGVDPMTLLDELRGLGQAHIETHVDEVPELPLLEAEHCYLWWEILLVTESSISALRDVFAFVEGDCELRLRLLEDQAAAVAVLGSIPADTLALFQQECEDQLEQVESAALEVEKHREATEDLAALFRGIHNIKGNAGALLGQIKGSRLIASHPLQMLHQVAHGLESLLDPFRAGGGPVPQEAVETSLETCDAIRGLLAGLKHRGGGTVSAALLGRLGVAADLGPAGDPADQRLAAFLNTTSQWVATIAGCLERLENEGGGTAAVLETYLRGVRTLSSAARYRNFSDLEEPLAQQLRILDAAVREGAVLGVAERSALSREFRAVCSILKSLEPEGDATASAEPAANGLAAEKGPAAERTASSTTIRIDQDKLDRLMRVAGELLVARGAFPLLVQKLKEGVDSAQVAKELKDAGSNISRITDELQASVMSIRMQPAKAVFQKFPRLVRDLARSLGKEVQLVMEGESIELDKTILEQIADPLIHVIRNALDHGLEPPDERLARGKEARGELKVRAANEASGVVMEVSDDGRGLDAEALKRKAVKQGLVTAEAAAAMSEEAAFQLIFLPGLSTAEKVTSVSGRGVGMDVVRSNVHSLHGTVEIRSKRGRGTTLSMKLPTSLMISKGILLEAGAQEYILPLGSIRDMVKMPREEAHQYQGLRLAQVRGHVYPVFTLAETLGLTASEKPELSLAIVEADGLVYALAVDRFVSEVEVLVKPLTGGLEQCREFQGAAIMGDGRVVLVLNALECHSLEQAACA
jgi:two-component system chemotaxis sensor kinase CheA